MDKRYFSEKVVEWYLQHQRTLPWRNDQEPYKIWLSEIILQQTRVIQGLPYYIRFIKEFPTVEDLAAAHEQKVLRLWQGLGYYTRARNLHKCAKEIVEKHNGIFPGSFQELKMLPGIGDYTAAAISSIAFQEPVAVVDGNVFRVLARIFGLYDAINSLQGRKKFAELAKELIHNQVPGQHNQAIMEFGALYCIPKNPDCPACIFNSICYAFKKVLQNALPVKIKGKASRKRYFYYIVLQKGSSLLMHKRTQNDIWEGLFDFYLIEKNRPFNVKSLIEEDDNLKKLVILNPAFKVSETYKHVLTHQNIFAKFILFNVDITSLPTNENLKFYSKKQIESLPKPVLISRFLATEHLL